MTLRSEKEGDRPRATPDGAGERSASDRNRNYNDRVEEEEAAAATKVRRSSSLLCLDKHD